MTTEPRTVLTDPKEIANALAQYRPTLSEMASFPGLNDILSDAIHALRNVKDPTYNGWANYETWCVNLYLQDDADVSRYWDREALGALYTAVPGEYPWQTRQQQATYALSRQLKDEHEENEPELEGVYSDMLSAAFSEVRWDRIAEHLIEAAIEANPDWANDGDDDETEDEDQS